VLKLTLSRHSGERRNPGRFQEWGRLGLLIIIGFGSWPAAALADYRQYCGWGPGMMGWGPKGWFAPLDMILFWVLMILVIVLLMRRIRTSKESGRETELVAESALEILKKRSGITNRFMKRNLFMKKETQCIHSGTKYLGGHSDLCCGVVVTTAEKTALIREMARNLGGSLDANSAYLLERSLKTLSLRVGRQSENALCLAEFLERQGGVIRVFYPGLPNFPGHNLAKSQMRAFGGMLSFELGRATSGYGPIPPAAEADHPGGEPGGGGIDHLRPGGHLPR
jgi:uncharacterized membrane protein